MTLNSVIVAGAGRSGLAAAIELARHDVAVTVIEQHDGVGERFHGDLQGFENWSTERDVLNPTLRPWPVRSDRPLRYLHRARPGRNPRTPQRAARWRDTDARATGEGPRPGKARPAGGWDPMSVSLEDRCVTGPRDTGPAGFRGLWHAPYLRTPPERREDRLKSRGQGGGLHCQEIGHDGPLVVFLPGVGATTRYFEGRVRPLAATHRLPLVDLWATASRPSRGRGTPSSGM